MIRAYYGIAANPFTTDRISLLPHQQEVFDILQVHAQQGGLCLLMGDAGTGKTMIKNTINQQAGKTTLVVGVARTLHTYFNTIKILCHVLFPTLRTYFQPFFTKLTPYFLLFSSPIIWQERRFRRDPK